MGMLCVLRMCSRKFAVFAVGSREVGSYVVACSFVENIMSLADDASVRRIRTWRLTDQNIF